MKLILRSLVSTVILLALALPALADENWLQNGDFSQGINNWRGNGRSPADFAMDNPLDKPDPLTAQGLILPLRHTVWSKVAQDFRSTGSTGVLSITFKVSPDLAFSTKPDDYKDVPGHVGFGGSWMPFPVPEGTWVVFIADFASGHGTYYKLKPEHGANGEPKTVKLPVGGLTALETKTITICIPPGDGKLVLLNVTLKGKG